MPEPAQRRQAVEALAETLHPPALLVHGDQQRRGPDAPDLGHQLPDLVQVLEIPAEENDRAHERIPEPDPLGGRERQAFDIQHQWPEGHRRVRYVREPG